MIVNADWNIFGLQRFAGISGEGNQTTKILRSFKTLPAS
jgi:hypothetical protein